MENINESKDTVWEMIDREKKRDLFVQRISRVTWAVTLLMLAILLVFGIVSTVNMYGLYQKGAIHYTQIIDQVIPLVIIVGSFTFIVAILSTVGMFLRLRTTSLLEIQQRLANLEEVVTSREK